MLPRILLGAVFIYISGPGLTSNQNDIAAIRQFAWKHHYENKILTNLTFDFSNAPARGQPISPCITLENCKLENGVALFFPGELTAITEKAKVVAISEKMIAKAEAEGAWVLAEEKGTAIGRHQGHG